LLYLSVDACKSVERVSANSAGLYWYVTRLIDIGGRVDGTANRDDFESAQPRLRELKTLFLVRGRA
jgi:hypothetical protein